MTPVNTSTISIEQFRADWDDYIPISQLCVKYGISKDQLIRLRLVLALSPRMDCTRRYKPRRGRDPSPSQIAAACLRIQATWDQTARESRAVYKQGQIRVSEVLEICDDSDEDETWHRN